MADQDEVSDDQLPDHAGVAFHPPVMLISMLVIGWFASVFTAVVSA